MKILTILALIGNILFFMFFIYNAIDDGVSVGMVQRTAEIGITLLTALNIIVLIRKSKQ